MAEIRRCVTCKHKNVDVDEEPCVICKKLCPTATKDMYEPMEERTEKLTNIAI